MLTGFDQNRGMLRDQCLYFICATEISRTISQDFSVRGSRHDTVRLKLAFQMNMKTFSGSKSKLNHASPKGLNSAGVTPLLTSERTGLLKCHMLGR